MAGEIWSHDEVEAAVADYFVMLRMELAGEAFNKSRRNEALRAKLAGRSHGSVERKHQNISAILVRHGVPYVDGYKPLGNIQKLLEDVVLEHLAADSVFFESALQSPVLDPTDKPALPSFRDIAEVPPDPIESGNYAWTPEARGIAVDFVQRDAENRRLGRLGEEFVWELEQRRLHDDERRPDLAKRVEWTARDRGDGLGYDIRSFEADEGPRYIEVKTTGLAKAFPFQVTANEVACSAALRDRYHLYRLFRFSSTPGLYVLTGSLEDTCRLAPTQYRARFT